MRNNGSTLFKITGILAIIFGSLCCLGFLAIFPLLIGIPLIIGGIQYLKYADYTNEQIAASSSPIIVWTVVFFMAGVLLGILSLLAYLSVTNSTIARNVNPNNYDYNNSTEVTGEIRPDDTNKSDDDKISKLERLNKLKEQGLISEEEYNNLKNDLLKK